MKGINKNNLILAISALLIVLSIIIVAVATIAEKKMEQAVESTPSADIVSQENVIPSDVAVTQGSTAPATAQAPTKGGNDTGKYKIATENDPLSLRISPDGDRIGEVPKGATVDVVAVYDGWGYITHDGTKGWIALSYTEFVSASATQLTNAPGKYIINTKDDPLGIRTQPDGSRDGEIPKGTEVEVLTVCKLQDTEWGFVEYDGEYGWLSFEYLKMA